MPQIPFEQYFSDIKDGGGYLGHALHLICHSREGAKKPPANQIRSGILPDPTARIAQARPN
jgi:hypothetical protein